MKVCKSKIQINWNYLGTGCNGRLHAMKENAAAREWNAIDNNNSNDLMNTGLGSRYMVSIKSWEWYFNWYKQHVMHWNRKVINWCSKVTRIGLIEWRKPGPFSTLIENVRDSKTKHRVVGTTCWQIARFEDCLQVLTG